MYIIIIIVVVSLVDLFLGLVAVLVVTKRTERVTHCTICRSFANNTMISCLSSSLGGGWLGSRRGRQQGGR